MCCILWREGAGTSIYLADLCYHFFEIVNVVFVHVCVAGKYLHAPWPIRLPLRVQLPRAVHDTISRVFLARDAAAIFVSNSHHMLHVSRCAAFATAAFFCLIEYAENILVSNRRSEAKAHLVLGKLCDAISFVQPPEACPATVKFRDLKKSILERMQTSSRASRNGGRGASAEGADIDSDAEDDEPGPGIPSAAADSSTATVVASPANDRACPEADEMPTNILLAGRNVNLTAPVLLDLISTDKRVEDIVPAAAASDPDATSTSDTETDYEVTSVTQALFFAASRLILLGDAVRGMRGPAGALFHVVVSGGKAAKTRPGFFRIRPYPS